MQNIEDITNNLTQIEQEQFFKILKELNNNDFSTYQKLMNDVWEEIPVDIDTFIDDPRYMRDYWYDSNNKCAVYPYWRKKLKEIFFDPYQYNRIVLTGGIGLGKSEIAKLGISYMAYRLLCLKNPHEFYHKPVGKPLNILFFSNDMNLAESVLLDPFVMMLKSSPWFMNRGTIIGHTHEKYVPHKLIRFKPGSRSNHALGSDTFACIIDEINFASGANIDLAKSKIMDVYSALYTRITDRFKVEGKVHGAIWLVSSKKSEYDFLERYTELHKGERDLCVIDDKAWIVKPPEITGYSGKMWNLAIGGNKLPSKIVRDHNAYIAFSLNKNVNINDFTETTDDYIKQGYEIMEIPAEEIGKFEEDMERNLMDIAALSISYVTKFLNYDIISQCYSEDLNPFDLDVLGIGTKDDLEIKDFFNIQNVPHSIRKKPHYLHIDTSLTGDNTGIGGVCMLGKEKIEKFDLQSNKTIKTYQAKYKHTFNIEIKCPKGAEISFQKTRNFIIYLRQNGWNICGISVDGYNSSDTLQMLASAGFENLKRLQFEKTPEIYMSLRSSLIEKRIILLPIKKLENELLLVERNNQSGKISHPPNTGDGHGDGADALAGALYCALLEESNHMDNLTSLSILGPGDNEIDKENLLKIITGVANIEKSFDINPNKLITDKEVKKKSGISNWIL